MLNIIKKIKNMFKRKVKEESESALPQENSKAEQKPEEQDQPRQESSEG